MKKAYNQYNKLVNIMESTKKDTYTCPVCKEVLTRNFGEKSQYYSHPKGTGQDCELKLKLIIKDDNLEELSQEQMNILKTEYYDKEFNDIHIELSDYKSDEGYYLTQEQKDIIFAKEDRIKISALAGCVDCDTEYFNGVEWKKISEYKQGDMVFQFNNNWQGELVNPLEYIKIPCNQMTRYKTKYGIDMVLSDEHNVVYIDTSHNKNNYWKNVNLLKIKEYELRERHIKNKTGFTGKFITTFDYESNNTTGLSEYQLRLTIAIMADGTYQKNHNSNWCRMNLKKQYKKDRLKLLLDECKIEYTENQWNPNDLEYTSINFYSPLKLKHFPKEWYKLNKKEREIIFEEIKHWDGDCGFGNRGITFRTSSKEDADFIQFIISSLGKRSTIDISKEIGEQYILSTNGKEYTRKSLLYTVHEVGRNSVVSMGQQSKVENKNKVISTYKTLDGYKYCFTVPSGMLILRRNNNIFITGNSAKSSTLYYYAKERPFKRILYLVYNKSMKDEADKMYSKLPHVEVRTIHSLGFGFVGKFYKNKLIFNYGVFDVIKDLNLNWNNDMELAVKINKMMNEYSLSDAMEFDDLDLFDVDERPEVINNCKKLWELKKNYNNNIKVTHDDYLKMFQLSKKSLDYKYDIIMLDEAQDSSLLVLDILKSSNVTGLVVVGDKFQSIYGWRNATNIMPHFEGKEYKLTTSFRVSQNIANIANIIVKDINKVDIDMKGFNVKQKIVNEINKNKPYVCLCRTNAYIFAEVFEVINNNSNAKLFFEGGYSSYNFNNIKDFYFYSKGHKTKNPLFNKFDDFYSMIEYANDIEDVELLALNRMVNKYGSKIPQIVDRIKNNTTTKKSEANVIFSTCHRAKGQTYTIPVYVSDDHFDVEEVFNKEYVFHEEFFDINKYYEEMCILYVAITRAANEIELSPKLKSYLLLRWNHFNNASIKNTI